MQGVRRVVCTLYEEGQSDQIKSRERYDIEACLSQSGHWTKVMGRVESESRVMIDCFMVHIVA